MKKPVRLVVLMIFTILVIVGFQIFWLYQSYQREKNALEMRAGILFREAVTKLQESRFHITGDFRDDSLIKEINIRPMAMARPLPHEGKRVVNMMNLVERKTRDTLNRRHMVITVDRSFVTMTGDSGVHDNIKWSGSGNGMIRLMYSIDSLQDSIRVRDVDSAFSKLLAENKTVIPFSITRTVLEGKEVYEDNADDEIIIGLKDPIALRFAMGNTFPYLIKRISSPVIFSIFLAGVTVLSFVLLYRNLLRQRRLTALKNDFISNVTHELKTPIATVSVAIEALKNFNALNDTKRTSEYLDISQNELQRLSMLVDKVLKLSMFEQQSIRLNKEWFDLAEIVHQVVESMRIQLEKAGALVHFNAPDGGCRIHADKLHITSVVYNLLDNALKYSPQQPEIHINLLQQKTYAELSIRDNGIGIEPEYRNRIFDKFFRVPNHDKHNIKGYGLGLSYVAYIAQMHQGFIEVSSTIGEGSVFTVKIPLEESAVIEYDHNRSIRKESKEGIYGS